MSSPKEKSSTIQTELLSHNQMIKYIRDRPSLAKSFIKLTFPERKRLLLETNGDTWNLAKLMQTIIDDRDKK